MKLFKFNKVMNTDVWREIMLNLPYKDTLSMCSVYQLSKSVCNHNFWTDKILLDYGLKVKGSQQEYKKIMEAKLMATYLISFSHKIYEKINLFIEFSTTSLKLLEIVTIAKRGGSFIYKLFSDEPSVEYDELSIIKVLTELFYKHPNIKIKDAITDLPIMYEDLLNYFNFNHEQERQKRIKAWKEVLNM